MATLLSTAIILQVGSHRAQLFFQAAQERMTAQNPPATNCQDTSLDMQQYNIHTTNNQIGIILPLKYCYMPAINFFLVLH